MKAEKRPQLLLCLLVGALLLSTGLNFYFLLRLDARLPDALLPEPGPPSLSLPGPGQAPSDTAQLFIP